MRYRLTCISWRTQQSRGNGAIREKVNSDVVSRLDARDVRAVVGRKRGLR